MDKCEGCKSAGKCDVPWSKCLPEYSGTDFDPKTCPETYLQQEIAKLREQLAAAESYNRSVIDGLVKDCARLRQRAEAAEAKLKAASEQEPVAIYEGDTSHLQYLQDTDMEKNWRWHRKDFVRGQKLYAAPIPPADVQELQSRVTELDGQVDARDCMIQGAKTVIAELEQESGRLVARNIQLNQLIAELERKLAEQQATVKNFFGMYARELPDVGEELNTLLAQAREEGRKAGEEIATHERVAILRNGREEGRKEAVPDVDWLSNVIRSVDGKHDLSAGTLAEKIVEAIRKNTGEP